MKLPRRKFLRAAAGAVALPALSRIASASDYRTRPVRIIVGFAAGGANDIFARLMGQWLSERLGQQFIIENRPGATGNNCYRGSRARARRRLYTFRIRPGSSH
jgi:tripartite-type tricarboxylate transporter receptor subunit TctC